MKIQEFVEKSKGLGYTREAIAKFKEAISLVRREQKGQKRLSGEASFRHNLRVGSILLENKLSEEVILAGLLHSIKDKEKIEKKFGKEVFLLLEESEEVKRIKFRNKKLEADALRKVLFTTLKDIRVIFIKLANKLDNLRSIEVFPKKEQERIAQEVLEIYAPLAYRLGLEKFKVNLEDLAFKVLNPRRYKEIANFLKASQEEREKDIAEAISLIKKTVKGKVSILKIKGRPKHMYSIYKKITQRKVNLNEQFDLLGLRIIVPEISDCYTLLGLLHENFKPVEGRLKDYILNPKPNFYRSIHTAVKLPNEKIAEIQIRTPEMDAYAGEGVAAHWQYKGLVSEQSFEKKISWLRKVLEGQKNYGDKEFLEAAKVDVFGDKVYCYTPQGDLKELPEGATLLDFAYAVHGDIGNKAVAGRVNGKFVPLRHELNQGDVVEILTNKHQRPRMKWIKFVKSTKAKQKIRKSLKAYQNLPGLHYHLLKPLVKEELGVLTECEEFPKAVCVLAKCCYPLPGEPIVGILTKRRKITVHRKDCKAALKFEERWIPVDWKKEFNQKIRFFIRADERSGLLADLLHTIAQAGFEVKEAKAKLIDLNHAQCSFLIIPRDLEHLKELIKRVRKVKGIKKIYFE